MYLSPTRFTVTIDMDQTIGCLHWIGAHRPEQALGDALLWAHRAAAQAAPAWTLDALPGGQRLPAGVREALLQQWVTAGALQRASQALRVHDAAVLASIACGCHAAGLQAEGA